ncbi:RE1-silencing transcription factor [Python bivittatus]|uniref:RE1-silencing transcription factor n=1 Tax=Python bivittatus TaxID=176946 RepID=A0A9F5MYS0_PYTBI|nr:RE1-silencing transcription factor [Python bivittatus]XP_025021697.1 RE1-silencing transcription factor [Python bivittatus]XP_025021698.1 RE1-silencing transcription factor [Python bivittatus]
MAMQVLGQSGASTLFSSNTNLSMALSNDMYDFSELSKAELAAPQLIMLANVALTGEVNGNCCDYMVGEERQMAELTTVGNTNFSDSDGEGIDDSQGAENGPEGMEDMDMGLDAPEVRNVETTGLSESAVPHSCNQEKGFSLEAPDVPESIDDKCKGLKNKPFRCKPCQYEAESEKEFVHHIRVHSAKRFIVEEKAEKHGQVKETDSSTTEEVDFSKGPIRCDRCGYNTNRYDHYLAHLKHHNKAGENERVYKCTICTYTTVSEYHWKKHLRNHFPRKVYTCSQCSYFSDRKNNYVQHIRTHTGERPYRCSMCPYSSSQKTHLTRHMRTHSGEKPFKCEQCSYVASNQHEVTRHARQVHDGPKPLACPHCDYKTADRSNFKKHVELHVSPRQFLCPVCEYAASKKCNLQYHIKSRHPDCCDITMDVSKVRLRTKKSEVNTSENISSAENKVEQEQTKKELTEKKNERAVKEEKKESLSKEKKPTGNVSVGQITTRSRKIVGERKEENVKIEKTIKTKKAKRKAETSSIPLTKDLLTDIDVMVRKKKKTEKIPPKCQYSQKGESKLEVTKKSNSCLKKNKKKKYLKSKTAKNNSSPDCEKIADDTSVHKEHLIHERQRKTSDASSSEQEPALLIDGENQFVPGMNIQDQELLPAQHVGTNIPLEMKNQEMLTGEEETVKAVSENNIEIELAVMSGTSSVDSNTTMEKEAEVPRDILPDLCQDIQITQTCEMKSVTNPDLVQGIRSVQTCEKEIVTKAHQEDDCSTKQLQAEDPAGTPPHQKPEKLEQNTQADLVSSSPSGTIVNENQEVEEDEGIHSHDGSDISDNISEGSDDSGLNGARTAQEKTGQKSSQEVAEAKATKENYVCIFCDRSFKKKGEYSKHLNRHLVNVYYLEKATKEQD